MANAKLRISLRSVGIVIMLVGAVTYAIGILLTPGQPYYVYENETRRNVFKIEELLWPHSAPELNPLAPAVFDIALLGAAIGILGVVRTSLKSKSTEARPT